jgi:chromosome segregation ATPase
MQFAPVSMEAIIGWIGMGLLTLLNYKIKLDVKNELDKLKTEIAGSFVQIPLATEQRSSLMYRLEAAEKEIASNRSRLHELQNDIMKQLVAEIFEVKNALTDKARRMGAMEQRAQTIENMQHDMANRQADLSGRVSANDQRITVLERERERGREE